MITGTSLDPPQQHILVIQSEARQQIGCGGHVLFGDVGHRPSAVLDFFAGAGILSEEVAIASLHRCHLRSSDGHVSRSS